MCEFHLALSLFIYDSFPYTHWAIFYPILFSPHIAARLFIIRICLRNWLGIHVGFHVMDSTIPNGFFGLFETLLCLFYEFGLGNYTIYLVAERTFDLDDLLSHVLVLFCLNCEDLNYSGNIIYWLYTCRTNYRMTLVAFTSLYSRTVILCSFFGDFLSWWFSWLYIGTEEFCDFMNGEIFITV